MAIDPICGMQVDESTNLKLDHNGKTYYFCSPRCLKKFAAQNNIHESGEDACSTACEIKADRWYKNKVLIVSFVWLLIIGLSYIFKFLEPVRFSMFMYLRMMWLAITVGFILGGMIDYYVPGEYVSKILSKKTKVSILYSVFLGFLMTSCCHGVLALTMQLYKKGASTPSVVSLLLASPWANMAFTIMLVGFFGIKGIYIISAALVVSVITGLIFQYFEKWGLVETNPNALKLDEDFSITADIKKRFSAYRFSLKQSLEDLKGVYSGTIALSNMVLWWLLIGMAIASFASAYIPGYIFHRFMGPTLAGLLVTLAAATVIEVCSSGAAPLAFEIYRQTGSLGSSYVFLMAGVVTNYSQIGLIWTNIGKRTAVWIPIVTIPQVLVFGMLANYLFK